jgi:hypothetical protein
MGVPGGTKGVREGKIGVLGGTKGVPRVCWVLDGSLRCASVRVHACLCERMCV